MQELYGNSKGQQITCMFDILASEEEWNYTLTTRFIFIQFTFFWFLLKTWAALQAQPPC